MEYREGRCLTERGFRPLLARAVSGLLPQPDRFEGGILVQRGVDPEDLTIAMRERPPRGQFESGAAGLPDARDPRVGEDVFSPRGQYIRLVTEFLNAETDCLF